MCSTYIYINSSYISLARDTCALFPMRLFGTSLGRTSSAHHYFLERLDCIIYLWHISVKYTLSLVGLQHLRRLRPRELLWFDIHICNSLAIATSICCITGWCINHQLQSLLLSHVSGSTFSAIVLYVDRPCISNQLSLLFKSS